MREWAVNATRRDIERVLFEAFIPAEYIRFFKVHFEHGMRYKEIADEFGVTEQYVKRAMDTVYRKIGEIIL